MKQYLISEEELKELGRVIYNIGYDRNSNREVKIEIDDFLKSKKPVEIIKVNGILTEGEITKIYINTSDYEKDLSFSEIYLRRNNG